MIGILLACFNHFDLSGNVIIFLLVRIDNERLFLSKINFIFKVSLALCIIGFSVWYEDWKYNLFLTFLTGIFLYKEKITLFRFPRQGYFFALLLGMMFLFRAFNEYGRIILRLPFGWTLTDEGVTAAFTFISQLALIFLLLGLVIFSTERREIFYYFKRIGQWDSGFGETLKRAVRIAMYVIYLLPKSFDYRKEVSAKLKTTFAGKRFSFNRHIKIVFESIYDFIFNILKRSEEEFPAFQAHQESSNFKPSSDVNYGSYMLITTIFLGVHAALVWLN